MIDFDADADMLDELVRLWAQPSGTARTERLENLLAKSDDQGLIHSAIYARTYLAGDLIVADVGRDLTPVLGLFAETQQLLQDHQGELSSEVFRPVVIHMGAAIVLLLLHPEMPLDRIEAVRAGYELMCRQHGYSLRGAHLFAMSIAILRGDVSEAERHFTLAQAQPRGSYIVNDTFAEAIGWYTSRGKYAEAVALYKQATPETESRSWAGLQIVTTPAALRAGDAELAAHLYDEAHDPQDVGSLEAPLLTYLALAGRLDEALVLLPDVVAYEDNATDSIRSYVAQHAAVLLHHLQAAGRGAETVQGLDGSVDELLARYREIAESTARTLDRVNSMDVAVLHLHDFWNRFGPAPLSAPATEHPTRMTQERTE